SLIALASRVISRSKPGTSAIRSASRRRSYQARSPGGARSCAANAASELSSTDQASSSGGRGEGGEGEGDGRDGVARLGIVAQRVGQSPNMGSEPAGNVRCVTRERSVRINTPCFALRRDAYSGLSRPAPASSG